MTRTRTHSAATVDALAILGRQITVERKHHRWTQAELAERVGVSTPTIVAVEKGSASTRIGTVFEIADLLGIPLVGARDGVSRSALDLHAALLPQRIRRPKDDDDDF